MTHKQLTRSFTIIFLQLIFASGLVVTLSKIGETQERRAKVRISNAGFTCV
jgi:hypothetical protein